MDTSAVLPCQLLTTAGAWIQPSWMQMQRGKGAIAGHYDSVIWVANEATAGEGYREVGKTCRGHDNCNQLAFDDWRKQSEEFKQ